ncbi:hypothetical protein GU335_05800 [Pseudolactococcus raffinolactis]|uniref:hypothetical protein n=1 Tax=Pseudolactococcus raffinolactis TaxID=1366 RepID=UPI001436EF10|nr:hypothetical protein [Lactococcus raffinolactis]QIW56150.1 hypothetical protein GU335_05800 [Lactococcus raffinolactis]
MSNSWSSFCNFFSGNGGGLMMLVFWGVIIVAIVMIWRSGNHHQSKQENNNLQALTNEELQAELAKRKDTNQLAVEIDNLKKEIAEVKK